jgi:hypothetical protein
LRRFAWDPGGPRQGAGRVRKRHRGRQCREGGEQLRIGALEDEATSQRRLPGLQIVVIANDGSKRVAFEPPPPMLDAVPVPEAEPVPSDE